MEELAAVNIGESLCVLNQYSSVIPTLLKYILLTCFSPSDACQGTSLDRAPPFVVGVAATRFVSVIGIA